MKILVAGATGTVGQNVVKQALGRGHEVLAIARNSAKFEQANPLLTTASADVLDPAAIEPLLSGIDAVVSTIGIGTSTIPTTIYSQGTRNLLSAMELHGVKRIVVISSEVADHWAHQGLIKLWVVLPLLQKFLGATYDDMRRMDIALWESSADWSAVRAPRIRPTNAKAHYRLDTAKPLPHGWAITATDMATALLDVAERSDLGRKHLYVAN